MMSGNKQMRFMPAFAIAVLLGAGAPALAHDHDHSHDSGPAQLTLNNGKKWATDDNLRQAMSRIRDELTTELPAIRQDRSTPGKRQKLAQEVNNQIAFMVQNCKLDRDADAMLHLVLADIIAGAEALAGPDHNAARQGAERIAQALDGYGTHFDHPGWQGVKPGN